MGEHDGGIGLSAELEIIFTETHVALVIASFVIGKALFSFLRKEPHRQNGYKQETTSQLPARWPLDAFAANEIYP